MYGPLRPPMGKPRHERPGLTQLLAIGWRGSDQHLNGWGPSPLIIARDRCSGLSRIAHPCQLSPLSEPSAMQESKFTSLSRRSPKAGFLFGTIPQQPSY